MTVQSVSVIVPVHNGAEFLAEALNSLLAQTRRPDQIIVVDDGSTDGSADVASRFGTEVTLVRQENRGPSSARNRGLDLASGSHVGFLDADDLWVPDCLSTQL